MSYGLGRSGSVTLAYKVSTSLVLGLSGPEPILTGRLTPVRRWARVVGPKYLGSKDEPDHRYLSLVDNRLRNFLKYK